MVKDKQLKEDLLEVGRMIDKFVRIPRKPRLCKYCGIELLYGNGIGEKKMFCSKWCIDQKNVTRSIMFTTKCSIEGCEHYHSSNGYCKSHYNKYREHGDPLYVRILKPKKEKKEKVMRACSIEGCDEQYSAKGYCKIHYDRFRVYGDALYTRKK